MTPTLTPGRPPSPSRSTRRTLANGAELLVLENHFNPTVAVSGSFYAGPLFAPAGPARRSRRMTAGELTKGTERRTKLEIAEDLESRGASLSFSVRRLRSGRRRHRRLGALSRDVELLLDRLVEILRTPVFPGGGARQGEEAARRRDPAAAGPDVRRARQETARAAHLSARPSLPPADGRGADRARRVADPRRPRALLRRALRRAARSGSSSSATSRPERILDGLEAPARRLAPRARRGDSRRSPVPPPAPGSETVEMPDKANADVVLAAARPRLTRPDPRYLACVLANSALGQSSLTPGSECACATPRG